MRRFWARVLVSEYLVLYLCVAYVLILWPFVPDLVSGENLGNVVSNMLPLLVVAIGQTFVLIAGGIDLSVTSIVALSSVLGASVMTADGGLLAGSALAAPAGILAMVLVGLSLGLLNGVAVTKFEMPPFIVTLTAMMFSSGFAIWLTQSRNIFNLPPAFNAIGTGASFSIPNALILTAALGAVAHLALSRTLFGRWLYAIGTNAKACVVAGVPVDRTIILAYVVSALCAALASILYTGRLETGSPVLGQRIFLDVIGAAVIGGTSLFGGKGKILWTVFGVLFITLLDNSLNLLGLSYFVISIVKGGVILSAALVDRARTRLAGRA